MERKASLPVHVAHNVNQPCPRNADGVSPAQGNIVPRITCHQEIQIHFGQIKQTRGI